jgi:type II secretory pathway component PulF
MTEYALVLLLVPAALIAGGSAALWGRSRAYRHGRETGSFVLAEVLAAVGWFLVVTGSLTAVGLLTHVFAIVFCPLAAIVFLVAVRRYREAERRSLLWVLMAAAERGIPLEAAVSAFEDEHDNVIGKRARNLADYLEAGVPLALALQRSRNPVSAAALLAADLGQQTGTLGPALRQVVAQMDLIDGVFRSLLEKLFYLAFLVCYALLMLAFVMLKIMPVFRNMYRDFGLQLPPVTQALIDISEKTASGEAVLLLALVLLLQVIAVLALLYYVRNAPTRLPLANWLWWRADCALVLRWLAIAVRQQRPFAEMVRLMAGYFPRAALRWRLERAACRIESGVDWCDSLQRVGLLRPAEAGLFRAAERAGNLAWALEEMADSSVRRAAYRLQAWLNVLFPAVVIGFGGCVFFIALGILLPLFAMIPGLSGA